MKVKSFLGIIALLIISGILSFIAIYGIGELQIFGIKTLKLGLDLNGGVSIVYQAEKDEVTEEEMASAVSLIQRRLDRNGWTEGEASKQGENRIRVEIPGVADAETAVRDLGETAQLVFTDEEGRVLLTGSHIKKASMQVGQSTANQPASPYVSLEFNSTGKELFAIATSTNVGKQVAIVMDGE
ncbi:MAG: preprotein translocase subunit SecD, partial [Anaerotignaceae bacterium]